jgi:hypothetical protein
MTIRRARGVAPISLGALIAGLALAAAAPAALGVRPSAEGPKLPPGTLRGPAHRLNQYPTISIATAAQRRAAMQLRAEMWIAAREWRDPRDAAAVGFQTTRPRRRDGNRRVLWLHSENRDFRNDGVYLDPRRPETIVYADVPGRPLVLIGVMFSMPRRIHGPTPGGPITRWHTHQVCVRGERRGLTPRPDGSCPPGTSRRQGSEMLHAWFTNDLRSAFAIHAPEPELCLAGLLPSSHCRRAGLRCVLPAPNARQP